MKVAIIASFLFLAVFKGSASEVNLTSIPYLENEAHPSTTSSFAPTIPIQTLGREEGCFPWCATHSFPWSYKCGFKNCKNCNDCCKSWCVENTLPLEKKCKWKTCSGCEECKDFTKFPTKSPTALPTSKPPTSNPTLSTIPSISSSPTPRPTNGCIAWCISETTPWPDKCTWLKTCGRCPECANFTKFPTESPTASPTVPPTAPPTVPPTASPTVPPTSVPSAEPTHVPSTTKPPTQDSTLSTTPPISSGPTPRSTNGCMAWCITGLETVWPENCVWVENCGGCPECANFTKFPTVSPATSPIVPPTDTFSAEPTHVPSIMKPPTKNFTSSTFPPISSSPAPRPTNGCMAWCITGSETVWPGNCVWVENCGGCPECANFTKFPTVSPTAPPTDVLSVEPTHVLSTTKPPKQNSTSSTSPPISSGPSQAQFNF